MASFEGLLADEHEQFDRRGELLRSVVEYAAAQPLAATAPVQCPLSQRVDGKLHSWHFDGDDPRIVCVYCDEMRDAISGAVIRVGRRDG